MRLFLLPISTRRTLIYCERVREQLLGEAASQQPLSERAINYASQTWATWEKAEKGWQKQVTVWGNQLFKRIPYEEWGLKSIPPLTKRRREEVDKGSLKFECLFPSRLLRPEKVGGVLETLAKERQALHNRRFWLCVAWMPVTLPFTLVPVIPNLPFFYLVFRAYSHYRALNGGKLLEHLMNNRLVKTDPSTVMDEMYTAGLLHSTRKSSRAAPTSTQSETDHALQVVDEQTRGGAEEVMLLRGWSGKLLAEAFHLPEMEIEIERAVEQVEKVMEEEKGKKKREEEKRKEDEDEDEEGRLRNVEGGKAGNEVERKKQ